MYRVIKMLKLITIWKTILAMKLFSGCMPNNGYTFACDEKENGVLMQAALRFYETIGLGRKIKLSCSIPKTEMTSSQSTCTRSYASLFEYFLDRLLVCGNDSGPCKSTQNIYIFQIVVVGRFHSITPSFRHFLLDIWNPKGGNSHMRRLGMLVGKFGFNS